MNPVKKLAMTQTASVATACQVVNAIKSLNNVLKELELVNVKKKWRSVKEMLEPLVSKLLCPVSKVMIGLKSV